MHEVLHGHPTRNARINEAFVFLPIGLVWPFRRFKTLHLRHHADERLTDPLDDPESYYQALWQHDELPPAMRFLLRINNTMAGRFVLGPWLSCVGFFIDDAKQMAAGDKAIRKAWLLHAIGLAIVLPVVQFGFGMPLWLYVLVPVWLGQSLISIRTFAEHQWSEHPDGRTVIVERSPLSLPVPQQQSAFRPPQEPDGGLVPAAEAVSRPPRRMAADEQWLCLSELFRAAQGYAFKAKEPVVHPVLRRAPEPGRAFKPRIRARSVNGLGSAPVPAEPPKE